MRIINNFLTQTGNFWIEMHPPTCPSPTPIEGKHNQFGSLSLVTTFNQRKNPNANIQVTLTTSHVLQHDEKYGLRIIQIAPKPTL
jgi:hypothetical protein